MEPTPLFGKTMNFKTNAAFDKIIAFVIPFEWKRYKSTFPLCRGYQRSNPPTSPPMSSLKNIIGNSVHSNLVWKSYFSVRLNVWYPKIPKGFDGIRYWTVYSNGSWRFNFGSHQSNKFSFTSGQKQTNKHFHVPKSCYHNWTLPLLHMELHKQRARVS